MADTDSSYYRGDGAGAGCSAWCWDRRGVRLAV